MAKKNVKTSIELVHIEDALQRTGFGVYSYGMVIFAGLVIMVVSFETLSICFALPVIKCDLSISDVQIGVLGAVGFAGIIVSAYFWGYMADTTGRKRIMQISMIITFFVTILSSFAVNFEMLLTMRLLAGIFTSACSATIFAYLGEFVAAKHRNSCVLSAAVLCGMLSGLMPLLAWLLINRNFAMPVPLLNIVYKPWRLYVVGCGFLGFLCGIILIFLPETPKYLLSIGKHDEALAVLQKVHRWNCGKKSVYEVKALQPEIEINTNRLNGLAKSNACSALLRSLWGQTAPLFQEHLRKTFLSSIIQFIIFFTCHGLLMWFPYILNTVGQYQQVENEPRTLCDIIYFIENSNIGNATDQVETVKTQTCVTQLELSTLTSTLFYQVIYVSSVIILIFAVQKFGRKIVLFTELVFCGICGIVSVIITDPSVSVYIFILCMICAGSVYIMSSVVVDIYPTNLRGMAICISLMLGRVGSVVGSNVMGALIGSHCQETLLTSSSALILAALLSLALPNLNATASAEISHKKGEKQQTENSDQ